MNQYLDAENGKTSKVPSALAGAVLQQALAIFFVACCHVASMEKWLHTHFPVVQYGYFGLCCDLNFVEMESAPR